MPLGIVKSAVGRAARRGAARRDGQLPAHPYILHTLFPLKLYDIDNFLWFHSLKKNELSRNSTPYAGIGNA